MQQDQFETRAQLLAKLFEMMKKSKLLAKLDAARIEQIKSKYRDADDENIKNGIKILEDERQQDLEAQAKAKEFMTKRIEKQKQLKMIELAEQTKSEQQAGILLKEMPAADSHTSKRRAEASKMLLVAIVLVVILSFAGWWFLTPHG
jgi:D-alanyl-D-alanine carboxypeptidase